ncbi:MAG: type I-D CRISPR-associated protein Cas5/Csc1 [Candidatus Fischerbacteria bacterium RBG_13_37_8]|uniref:Type I-D CRISPR-associated protein Cas5/Csc1 n=1 Tax=Candidatus Fischerbacteria bacterium RBG_13_37_8 TaxID=1817863 RepID=A0A1F5VY03_9BACT|nr:MAG: type I-D CRISPR-associated protein Cas5/Csc1 [Candidatus Fischerbacteria bacterium RBG_13_37_8]
MADIIRLNEQGVRLFACRLYNHDYLWFSSYEISKLSATSPIIHNYALCYSLADYSYGIYKIGEPPHYEKDLSRMSLYATPAGCEVFSKTKVTFNAVDSKALLTEKPDRLRGVNTPDIGKRIYLNPVFKEGRSRDEPGFLCYVFVFNGSEPKGVTRLGKKGCAIRICREEIKEPTAFFKKEKIRPTHPVNPLDISGKILAYDPVSIPPHLIFRIADIEDDWFILSGIHRIHIPKRVIAKIT